MQKDIGQFYTKPILILIGIFVLTYFVQYVVQDPRDFLVYHHGARGVFEGTRPVYGENSGVGSPMIYRYPPLFLLVFAPLSILPLQISAAVWVIGKIMLLIVLIRSFYSKVKSSGKVQEWIVPLLLAGPYIVQEFRSGNAQFFIFAMVALALIHLRTHPNAAAFTLATAINLKVWPLFFVPYLAFKKEWRVTSCILVFTICLAMLPMVYFGFSENIQLLEQWFSQEILPQFADSQTWFSISNPPPNQSLRGVLMRYFTVIDYTKLSDTNYQMVHMVSLNPDMIRALCLGLLFIGYAGLLLLARSRAQSFGEVENGVAFCALVLFETASHFSRVVLLWPAMLAGLIVAQHIEVPKWVRTFIYAALVISIAQPFVPGASSQRLMQVLGFDFWVTILLTITMVWASVTLIFQKK